MQKRFSYLIILYHTFRNISNTKAVLLTNHYGWPTFTVSYHGHLFHTPQCFSYQYNNFMPWSNFHTAMFFHTNTYGNYASEWRLLETIKNLTSAHGDRRCGVCFKDSWRALMIRQDSNTVVTFVSCDFRSLFATSLYSAWKVMDVNSFSLSTLTPVWVLV